MKKSKEMPLITKNTLIGEIVESHPKSVRVLLNHGMECVGCHIALWESVEQVAQDHNVDPDSLVKELNKSCEVK